MVYGTIESHHGVIQTESSQGTGTTFHLYLPLIREVHQQTSSNDDIITGHGETILLVDDEQIILETSKALLQALDYEVITATNGEEAVQQFKVHSHDISLLITDIVMPIMGGIESAKSIRTLNHELPIIFCTGYDKNQQHLENGVIENCQLVSKPFRIEDLSQHIHSMLNT
ncbi:MAG: response regulator [Mariprofundaceae bacterium]